ncbi:unnamed protein product [Scytosiphon promiscuus]
MGNINLNCVPVIPLEAKEAEVDVGKDVKAGSGGMAVGGGWTTKRPVLMSELDDLHETPTTLTKVLSNALYAMAFHKHLALTNRSENYEFFQAVSHFTHESSTNTQLIKDAARMIYNLYVADDAPLRVALGDEIYQSIKKAIEEGHVTRQVFDSAQGRVLFLMETDSLEPFLSSATHKELRKRIRNGEMDTLMQEDLDSVKDIILCPRVGFLGDPDLKELLSSEIGVEKFRQYLVIEFAEEGIDLLTATRDMLDRSKFQKGSDPEDKASEARLRGGKNSSPSVEGVVEGVVKVGGNEVENYLSQEKRLVDGSSVVGEGNEGERVAAVVAPAAEGGVGPEATEESEGRGGDGEGGGMERPRSRGNAVKGEFDVRQAGKDIFERFIKSGCGAECNLPGTVVAKVSRALANGESTSEEIVQAFEQVEIEIFKLLAYDPFLRFKRQDQLFFPPT